MNLNPRPPQSRLVFLDWARGLAALIMLQGHVFHSFTSADLKGTGPYIFSQFVGGLPPALFLFLTGVTLAFLMHRRERQGAAMRLRVWAAVKRSGYLFGIAYLFRLQLWLFGWPNSPLTDLFKVDILNTMGMTILLVSVMALMTTAGRARYGALLGILMAAASPIVAQLNWSGIPEVVRHYFAPDYNHFSVFPWGAFLAFGVSAGSILRLIREEQLPRLMQWTTLAGLALILGGRYVSDLPFSLYSKSDFWLDSPALVTIKMGIILVVLSFAYLWTTYAVRGWSWVQQLGTTSLLVYWVHIELVYGRWFGGWKENLALGEAAIASITLVLLMVGMSVLRTNWTAIAAWFRYQLADPPRVSGD